MEWLELTLADRCLFIKTNLFSGPYLCGLFVSSPLVFQKLSGNACPLVKRCIVHLPVKEMRMGVTCPEVLTAVGSSVSGEEWSIIFQYYWATVEGNKMGIQH